ncbi:hypothetical protein DFH07DRAFT_749811 [Mycena maculata]|uniref:F-box domain-containing protein n=1 Tax=Mycena maculata TaxID=230809 RepID=A0AAD7IIH2_9AGAR|nr:hypothetical protein DFH07DRAFT_749811 [Mycena maculata]
MSALPGELVDSIIDLAYASSPSSMKACALVCRQWVPRSRHNYFSTISLIRNHSTDNVKTFLRLVASPLATFISSVREVHLSHRSSYGAPVLSVGDIVALLSRYGVNPTSFHLYCQSNRLSVDGAQGELFPSLTHFRITQSEGDTSLGKILDFIHSPPCDLLHYISAEFGIPDDERRINPSFYFLSIFMN